MKVIFFRKAAFFLELTILFLVVIGCSTNKNKSASTEANTKPISEVQTSKKPINVLIVDGFSNHDWQQTTKVTKYILEKSGLFKVSVSTAPSSLKDSTFSKWNPEFKKYDVVIQNCNNLQQKESRWPRPIQIELENYVKNGGGLYILHSANNSFQEWDEYNTMIGLGWRNVDAGVALEIADDKSIIRIESGEGEKTSHGPRFDAVIQLLNNHPINVGYPEKWMVSNTELYLFPRGPAKNLTVLSFAKDPVSKRNWPVEWIVEYGKGKVYNSSMGHLWKGQNYPVSYRCIGFQTTMIRAAEWLATAKVTYEVPDNFPSEESVSLVPEIVIE